MLELEGVAHLADLIQTKHSQGDVFDFELIRGRFFRAMKDWLEDGAPVNITFLFAELEATGIVRVIPGNFEFARIINFEFVPIRANHIDIIKLSSTESQSFKPIVTRLNTWIAQIGKSLSLSLYSRTHRFKHRRGRPRHLALTHRQWRVSKLAEVLYTVKIANYVAIATGTICQGSLNHIQASLRSMRYLTHRYSQHLPVRQRVSL
jgi:hypothetical protein